MTTARILGMFALTGAIACSSSPGDGKRYVLVHGAWLDHTGWDAVAQRLRDAGADVVAPDLPAHGDDATPASAASLAGYVDRVSTAIDGARGPVILVGHSMAGAVISQVAEQRPGDIEALVYIAAYVPRTGQSVLDLAMTDPDSQTGPNLVFNPDGTVDIKPAAFPELFCADCTPEASAALVASYQPEPGAPLGTPVTLSAAFDGVPKTYIHTVQDRVVSPSLQATMLTATPMDRELDVETSHVPMLAAPDTLADALLETP